MSLGQLKQVDLRKYWEHEAIDFTSWLSQDENLAVLSDEIGIDIKLIQTEANVGKFSVDILAEVENTGSKIIIENQLETTDHDHLGKILTYASGYDAEIVIWIVREVREEHKRAVDWLNEHTDEDLNFFIVRIELWQIDESPLAPKFQIISRPNDWAKSVKKSVEQSKLSETKTMQLAFWNQFKEYTKAKLTTLKLRKTYPQHWYNISIGCSEAHITLTINTQLNLMGCEIYIPDSKELFKYLEQDKEQIETELHEVLEWSELPGKKASRIKLYANADISDDNTWEGYFEWLSTKADLFQKVFSKYANLYRK